MFFQASEGRIKKEKGKALTDEWRFFAPPGGAPGD